MPVIRKPAQGCTLAIVGDVYRFLATGDSQGNLDCPQEEALDFPHSEDCPFWKEEQASNRRQ